MNTEVKQTVQHRIEGIKVLLKDKFNQKAKYSKVDNEIIEILSCCNQLQQVIEVIQ